MPSTLDHKAPCCYVCKNFERQETAIQEFLRGFAKVKGYCPVKKKIVDSCDYCRDSFVQKG